MRRRFCFDLFLLVILVFQHRKFHQILRPQTRQCMSQSVYRYCAAYRGYSYPLGRAGDPSCELVAYDDKVGDPSTAAKCATGPDGFLIERQTSCTTYDYGVQDEFDAARAYCGSKCVNYAITGREV